MDSASVMGGGEETVLSCVKGVLEQEHAAEEKRTIIFICLGSLGLEDTLVHHVGKALMKLSNRLCLVQPKGKRQSGEIVFGVCQLRDGGCDVLLRPHDYSLQKFHEACVRLQSFHKAESSGAGAKTQPGDHGASFITDQLLSLTRDEMIAEAVRATSSSVKLLLLLSAEEAQAHVDQKDLEAFLDQCSSKLVSVDFVEFRSPFEGGPGTQRPAPAAEDAIPHIVANCDTASYHDVDVRCEGDLEYFLCYQLIKPILGSAAMDIAFVFHTGAAGDGATGGSATHCMLSPVILPMNPCPESNDWVCPCHGMASLPAEKDTESPYFKCAVTHQFVPFQKSKTAFKLGSAYWEYSETGEAMRLGGARHSGEATLRAFSRISFGELASYEALLFGMPYVLYPSMMNAEQDFEASSQFWFVLLQSLMEREECLLGSCCYDFDRELPSVTPLNYLLIPDVSCRTMLVKRIASREELLTMESESWAGDSEVSAAQKKSVGDMLDTLAVCSDVWDISLRIDETLSHVCKHMEGKPCSSVVPEKAPAGQSTRVRYRKRPAAKRKGGVSQVR